MVRIPTASYQGRIITTSEALSIKSTSNNNPEFKYLECNQLINPVSGSVYTAKQEDKIVQRKQDARFEHARTSKKYCSLKDPRTLKKMKFKKINK